MIAPDSNSVTAEPPPLGSVSTKAGMRLLGEILR